MVADYAWSVRKMLTQNLQRKVWLQFCNSDGRHPLSVSEAPFVVFFGWLMLKQQRDGHQITSVSIPQYLSAVRQMQLTLTGREVPSYPFIKHVIRANKNMERIQ